VYGDKIEKIQFNYSQDDSNIDITERASFLSSLKTLHTAKIADEIILADARMPVNGIVIRIK
jgi:hypothetical protein